MRVKCERGPRRSGGASLAQGLSAEGAAVPEVARAQTRCRRWRDPSGNRTSRSRVPAVAGVHALVIGIIISRSRASRFVLPGGARIAAMFLVPVREDRRSPLAPSRRAQQALRIEPIGEPITLPASAVPARITEGPPVDWARATPTEPPSAGASSGSARDVMSFRLPRQRASVSFSNRHGSHARRARARPPRNRESGGCMCFICDGIHASRCAGTPHATRCSVGARC